MSRGSKKVKNYREVDTWFVLNNKRGGDVKGLDLFLTYIDFDEYIKAGRDKNGNCIVFLLKNGETVAAMRSNHDNGYKCILNRLKSLVENSMTNHN